MEDRSTYPNTLLDAPNALTEDEQCEYHQLIAIINTAEGLAHEAHAKLGHSLLRLRDFGLYREGGFCTWKAFVRDLLGYSDEYARLLIDYVEVNDALFADGLSPLTHEAQVQILISQPIETWVPAVQRGREIAETEGTWFHARHLEAAICEILHAANQDG